MRGCLRFRAKGLEGFGELRSLAVRFFLPVFGIRAGLASHRAGAAAIDKLPPYD